jgi:hypothetical protein
LTRRLGASAVNREQNEPRRHRDTEVTERRGKGEAEIDL